MTCKKKSTKKSPAYGQGFKPNFSVILLFLNVSRHKGLKYGVSNGQ